MSDVKIAVVDDGVSQALFPEVQNFAVEAEGVVERRLPAGERESHGEICLRIIRRYARVPAEWLSVQVLSRETERGNAEKLLRALDFCGRRGAELIHMSLGSSSFWDFDALQAKVRELTDRGVLLVAAANNRGTVTVPACLGNVLGVKCHWRLRGGDFCLREDTLDGIDYAASSQHLLEGRERPVPLCNSFAAPVVTAKVLDFLSRRRGASLEEVREHLRSCAVPRPEDALFPERLPQPGHDTLLLLFWGDEPAAFLGRMLELRACFAREGYYCGVATDCLEDREKWVLKLLGGEDLWRAHCFYQHDVLLLAVRDRVFSKGDQVGAVVYRGECPADFETALPDAPAEKLFQELLRIFAD